MTHNPNFFLIAGATLSALAALLHLGCIAFGARWYRFLGAGENMARMASDGRWYPVIVTLAIVSILSIWSVYALSGAGILPELPLTRLALIAITAVYLIRAVAFPAIKSYIPGNSVSWTPSVGQSAALFK